MIAGTTLVREHLSSGRMAFVDWIRAAAPVGAEGIGRYDGFFRGLMPEDVDAPLEAKRAAYFPSSSVPGGCA